VLDGDDPHKHQDTLLSIGERISLQQRDAITQTTDDVQFVDAEEPPLEEDLGLVDRDDALSRAEASLLKLAVVLNTEDDDINES
jgi:hypothetical protein